MAKLPADNILRNANGAYDVNVTPGREYLLALKGTFAGAIVKLQVKDTPFNNPAPGGSVVFADVIDGTFTGVTEVRLAPTSEVLRLSVTSAGSGTLISVTCIPILR
jgi:hypothetical protein